MIFFNLVQYHNLHQASNGIGKIATVSMNGLRVNNRNERKIEILLC
jgi:hypothetical protein